MCCVYCKGQAISRCSSLQYQCCPVKTRRVNCCLGVNSYTPEVAPGCVSFFVNNNKRDCQGNVEMDKCGACSFEEGGEPPSSLLYSSSHPPLLVLALFFLCQTHGKPSHCSPPPSLHTPSHLVAIPREGHRSGDVPVAVWVCGFAQNRPGFPPHSQVPCSSAHAQNLKNI